MEHNFRSSNNPGTSRFLSGKLKHMINNTRFVDIDGISHSSSSGGLFMPYAFPPSNTGYPYYSAYVTAGNKEEQ